MEKNDENMNAKHLEQLENEIRAIAKIIQEDRFKYNVLKLVGYGTSFVGGALCLVSAILIPFTFQLSSPLSIAGGFFLAIGSVISFGTSIKETVRLKAQVDKVQKIIDGNKKYFQEISNFLDHAADLEKALAEVLIIDIFQGICEDIKIFVKKSINITDHIARLNFLEQKLRSISKGIPAFTIAIITLPLATLFELLWKIENQLVFDWITLTLKGLFSIIQLADDAFDVVHLSRLLYINAFMGKTILHSAVAALCVAFDATAITLTSIDVYKGSRSPKAGKISKLADEMVKVNWKKVN